MNQKETKYDAFISYRHAEHDQYVAEVLHKELENYRLPKNITCKFQEMGLEKTRISRVFRDRDELPIASNLADPITIALQNSQFLIVICSPRLKDSVWCKKEIETFIAMHGREQVLAVLTEGEPNESFPQELLQDENGRSVEPLAADVRGNTKREIRKKIKEEVIRLAAPMFACDYDTLKQRHKEQKLKKIIKFSLAGAAICFVFSTISITMALRIQKQSVEIQQQFVEIQQQSVKIEEQYIEALRSNAKSMAEESLRILQTGDRMQAIQTAMEALEKPYTAEAQYALTESLYVYQDGSQILPTHVLHHDAELDFIKKSPDGNRILSVDRFGKLSVWNAIDGTKLCEVVLGGESMFVLEESVSFLNNDKIIYSKNNGFAVYDLTQGKEVYEDQEYRDNVVVCDKNGQYFAIGNNKEIAVFQTSDYKKVFSYQVPQGKGITIEMAMDDEGNYVAFSQRNERSLQTEKFEVCIVSISKGKIEQTYSISNRHLKQIVLSKSECYLSVWEEEEGEEQYLPKYTGSILAYSIEQNGALLWNYEKADTLINEIKVMQEKNQDLLLFSAYGYLGIMDRKSGKLVEECNYANTITDFHVYEDTALIGVMMRDGEYHIISTETMTDYVIAGKFDTASNNLKQGFMGEKYFSYVAYQDTKIVVYQAVEGKELETICPAPGYFDYVLVNKEETKIIATKYDTIVCYDLVKKAEHQTWIQEEGVRAIAFAGENQDTILAMLSNKIIAYDVQTGAKKQEIPIEESISNVTGFSEDGTSAVVDNYSGIMLLDTTTGKITQKMEQIEELKNLGVYAVSENQKMYAIASKKDKALKLYNVGETESVREIPINAACISYLNFSNEGQKLYLTFLDNRVEVYDVTTLSKTAEFTNFQKEVQTVSYVKQSGYTFLTSLNQTYVLNEKGELIASVDGCKAVLPNKEQYLIFAGFHFLSVPQYDLQSLQEEAKAQMEKKGD